MNATEREYRDWVASRKIKGCQIEVLDDEHIALKTDGAEAAVNFYRFDDMPEVVELTVMENGSENPIFFLHFELEDLDRAKELFNEMKEVLLKASKSSTKHILLCCTVGMTTSMFAAKLTEVAKTLSLDYTFEAKGLDDAKRQGGRYDAVMLAPQVGFRRPEVAEAFPKAVVFEIPAQIFARFDAAGALRMLLRLMGDDSLSSPDATNLRFLRDMFGSVTMPSLAVLIITVIYGPRTSTIEWRAFDQHKMVASDKVHKPNITFQDVEDVIATLHLKGIDYQNLDAVGIAIPGSVDYGTVTYSGYGFAGAEIEKPLVEKFGLRVFVDNNANAGAVGCYVSQNTYDSVTLHTQQVGTLIGGQGTICNGHLLRGRRGMAGELGALNWRVRIKDRDFPEVAKGDPNVETMYLEEAIAWSAEEMLPVLADMLQANIAVAAPDAIYINYDLIDDMNLLRAELAKGLEEECIPDLIHITDYHEKIFLGELALVLQRLNTSAD